MKGRLSLVKLIPHFFMGTVLVLKGIDKFPKHNVLGGLTFLFGLIAFAYFIYLLVKKTESHTMHLLIHAFEALAAFFTAYIFFEEGKKYVPYLFILAGIGFIIGIIVAVNRHKKNTNR